MPVRAQTVSIKAASLLLFALSASSANALQSDRDKAMDIGADSTLADLGINGSAVLSGNVRISQGTLNIESARATVVRKQGAIDNAKLEGAPARLQQDLDSGGRMNARARTIDYDVSNEILLLTGDVVVTQPEGDVRGERIRYDLKTGRLEGGGGRVQMTIPPRAAKPAAPNG